MATRMIAEFSGPSLVALEGTGHRFVGLLALLGGHAQITCFTEFGHCGLETKYDINPKNTNPDDDSVSVFVGCRRECDDAVCFNVASFIARIQALNNFLETCTVPTRDMVIKAVSE